MVLEARLDFIEFRMDLLREGTPLSYFLYDCNITRSQLKQLYDLMGKLDDKLYAGESINPTEYEAQVLKIVNDPQLDYPQLDYHFCESFAKMLWEEERYVEVFKALYKDNIKYKNLFQ